MRLESITKTFGNVTAVDDISLVVDDHAFMILLGPSGCGKSTMLRVIAGLEAPTTGDVYIGDVRVNDVEPKERDVAMVFQSYALYPHKSVQANIEFPLKVRGVAKAERAAQALDAADSLGLTDQLSRRPGQLSGGQRQRVALARAIVRHPAVFCMDEPLSNLDAKLRSETRSELVALHRRLSSTFIYVTHDQVEAMTMADKIVVLRAGRVEQIGAPLDLYNRPVNTFVAGFIGSPSMNFIDATLVESDGKLEINTGGFRLLVPEEKAKEWRAHKGKEVIFGIRPENIHAKQFVPPGIMEAAMKAKIEVVELMGNEIFLYLATKDNKQFVARVDPRYRTTMGQEVDLSVDMANAHIFDPKSEVLLAG